MFHSINWANYWLAIAILVLVYYAFIVCIYFKEEIRQVLHKPAMKFEAGNTKNAVDNDLRNQLIEEDDETPPWQVTEPSTLPLDRITATEVFLNEIDAFFNALDRNTSKKELRESLQKIISKYPALNDEHLRNSLNKLLGFYGENKCSIRFTEDDLRELWENKGGAFSSYDAGIK